VFFVVFYSKFLDGAWILLPMIAFLLLIMKRIKSHYSNTEKALSIGEAKLLNASSEDIMAVILVSKIDRRAVEGARVARGLRPETIRALHIAFEKEAGEKLETRWKALFPDIPMEIRVSDFREVESSILEYFGSVEPKWWGKIVAVVPILVLQNPFKEFLHNHTAKRIIEAIRKDPKGNAEIYEVPVRVERKRQSSKSSLPPVIIEPPQHVE
jgi:hypothetical protein